MQRPHRPGRSSSADAFFVLPALALFLLVIVVPFARGVGIAFTNWDGFSPTSRFVGFRNWEILFQDSALLLPLANTLIFTVLTVIFVNAIGLALALGVNIEFHGAGALRTIFFMPIVISLVLASFIWSIIFSDVLPPLFKIHGLLGDQGTVIIGLSIICVWRDCGLAMIIYLASLKTVPRELYEASRVDGAGAFQRFTSVTLPMIAPAFTINVTLWLGWGLKVFDYPMAATGGGPGRASWTLAIYVYQYAFPYGKAGYGQAAAILLFIVVFAAAACSTRILRRREVAA